MTTEQPQAEDSRVRVATTMTTIAMDLSLKPVAPARKARHLRSYVLAVPRNGRVPARYARPHAIDHFDGRCDSTNQSWWSMPREISVNRSDVSASPEAAASSIAN